MCTKISQESSSAGGVPQSSSPGRSRPAAASGSFSKNGYPSTDVWGLQADSASCRCECNGGHGGEKPASEKATDQSAASEKTAGEKTACRAQDRFLNAEVFHEVAPHYHSPQ